MEFCTVLPCRSQVPVDLHFLYSGSEQCAPGASWGPAIKDHYKLLFVHKGQGRFRCQGKVHTLTAGQGFLICPGVIITMEADSFTPWEKSWIAFHGSYAEAYLAKAGLSADQPLYHASSDTSLPAAFRAMREADAPGPSRELKMSAAFFHLMAVLLEEACGQTADPKPANRRTSYAARAREYVEVNYSREVTVEELAADLGLTRKYLSRLFKEEMGLSPQQYLLSFRLTKASRLLEETSLSIKEVSYSVGYKDPLLFSRMFKQHFGSSPRLYREASSSRAGA
ncbi:AraC family transcriptional regulator [Gorillibacterium sp. CAU 1737]|uniref:AraC family transcriptional regulator n=1 Tax=Gorillibacterium sp. CAU 1737 TaxID=3140362 RepID=UPI00325FE009